MNLPFAKQTQIRQRHEALRFQLVATELDLAITFCEVALNANDPTKHDRNIIAHAMKAYSAAVHFLLSDPKTAQELRIDKKLTRIGFLLGDFGDFGRMRNPAVM
jgi:hypothetical protein